jgi:hypothetical protein
MATSEGSGAAHDATIKTGTVRPDDDNEVARLSAKVEKIEGHLKAAKQALSDAKAAAKQKGV